MTTERHIYGVEYWKGIPQKLAILDDREEAQIYIKHTAYMDGGYTREIITRREAEKLAGKSRISEALKNGDNYFRI